jgi:hypothetical protein
LADAYPVRDSCNLSIFVFAQGNSRKQGGAGRERTRYVTDGDNAADKEFTVQKQKSGGGEL